MPAITSGFGNLNELILILIGKFKSLWSAKM